MLYSISRSFCALICRLLLTVKINGKENVPVQGGFILASNHKSNLDPILLAVVCKRKIGFMAKESLFKVPVLSWILSNAATFPVKRNGADTFALKNAIKKVSSGKGLGIFPEGTRSESKQPSKILPGIGFIAARTNAPVIPVFIRGTEIALPKGAKFIRPAKVSITFGKPVTYNKTLSYQEIAESVMNNIRKLQ